MVVRAGLQPFYLGLQAVERLPHLPSCAGCLPLPNDHPLGFLRHARPPRKPSAVLSSIPQMLVQMAPKVFAVFSTDAARRTPVPHPAPGFCLHYLFRSSA
jgi:hypothetical protein